MAQNTPAEVNRTERILRFMIASAIGLAILAIIAMIVGRLAGVNTSEGIWLTVTVLPPIGLIFGVLLIIAFMVVSAIRRSRAARDAGK